MKTSSICKLRRTSIKEVPPIRPRSHRCRAQDSPRRQREPQMASRVSGSSQDRAAILSRMLEIWSRSWSQAWPVSLISRETCSLTIQIPISSSMPWNHFKNCANSIKSSLYLVPLSSLEPPGRSTPTSPITIVLSVRWIQMSLMNSCTKIKRALMPSRRSLILKRHPLKLL